MVISGFIQIDSIAACLLTITRYNTRRTTGNKHTEGLEATEMAYLDYYPDRMAFDLEIDNR